jgi:hypothetical protein
LTTRSERRRSRPRNSSECLRPHIACQATHALKRWKEPVAGQIDKATQRVAFHLGKNTDAVIEAGAYNLTQDVASCKVYFGKGKPQTWLLVRLPAPKMPNAPTRVAVKSTPAPTGNEEQ